MTTILFKTNRICVWTSNFIQFLFVSSKIDAMYQDIWMGFLPIDLKKILLLIWYKFQAIPSSQFDLFILTWARSTWWGHMFGMKTREKYAHSNWLFCARCTLFAAGKLMLLTHLARDVVASNWDVLRWSLKIWSQDT